MRLLEDVVAEAEAAQHRRDLQIDVVPVLDAEAILQRAVALEQRVVLVLRHRRIAEALFDVVHLRFHVQQIGERGARFVENRAPGVREAVLRQVADGQR